MNLLGGLIGTYFGNKKEDVGQNLNGSSGISQSIQSGAAMATLQSSQGSQMLQNYSSGLTWMTAPSADAYITKASKHNYSVKIDESFKGLDIQKYLEAASVLNLENLYGGIVWDFKDATVIMSWEQMRSSCFTSSVEDIKNG